MDENKTLTTGLQDIPIDKEHFPDENFRAFVNEEYGTNGILTADTIARTGDMDCPDFGIEDLTGIEYFTALEELNCYYNDLTTLDVSKNTALKRLDCNYSHLKALDVSGCTALERLDCYDNNLTTLDVSNNTALKELSCHHNNLTALNVGNNTALEILYCEDNDLETLDVSGCTTLKWLNCSENALRTLNINECTALETLNCENNNLTEVDVSSSPILNAKKKRETYSQKIYQKYTEKYKDNPNLVKALSPEKIKDDLLILAISKKSYGVLDKLVEELNNMNDKLKRNRASLITLFEHYSNAGADKAMHTYVPKTFELLPSARNSYVPGLSIVQDYVRAEHERLTGKTIEQSIAELKIEKMSLKDIKANSYEALDLPYLYVSFSNSEHPDVLSHSFNVNGGELAIAAIKAHPEIAGKVKNICEKEINNLIKVSKEWPKVYSYNEEPLAKSNFYFDKRDKVISGLKNIVAVAEKSLKKAVKKEKDPQTKPAKYSISEAIADQLAAAQKAINDSTVYATETAEARVERFANSHKDKVEKTKANGATDKSTKEARSNSDPANR